jgi:hypothetical protein
MSLTCSYNYCSPFFSKWWPPFGLEDCPVDCWRGGKHRGIANAAQKNRGIVDPGTLLRHIAEGQCSAVIGGFLFEYRVLLSLAGDGCLVGTKDFVGLSYRKLLNRDIVACCILDYNRWTMFAVAEEREPAPEKSKRIDWYEHLEPELLWWPEGCHAKVEHHGCIEAQGQLLFPQNDQ